MHFTNSYTFDFTFYIVKNCYLAGVIAHASVVGAFKSGCEKLKKLVGKAGWRNCDKFDVEEGSAQDDFIISIVFI